MLLNVLIENQKAMPFRVETTQFCACENLPRLPKRRQSQRANGKGEYPFNWRGISDKVKRLAGGRCECCGHPRTPKGGSDVCDAMCVHPDDGKKRTLTVHHLDMNPGNCEYSNLVALCWTCHARVQSRLDWTQLDFMDVVEDWRGEYPRYLISRRDEFVSFVKGMDAERKRFISPRSAAAAAKPSVAKVAKIRERSAVLPQLELFGDLV